MNGLMHILCFFFLSICYLKANAQTNFAFEFAPDITVKVGTDTLEQAWSGGINFAQFSELDYDVDGDADLVLFDRSCNRFLIYERSNSPQPEYTFVWTNPNLFPSDIMYRAAFVDYDADGKNDLFTYGLGGLRVFRNTSSGPGNLQWTVAKEIVETFQYNSYDNLYVSSADIPAYVDVEGDGDIDVLTFNIGGERLEYHQNQSMDLYGIPDSLVFELKNECWGQFKEDQNNNSILLSNTEFPCGSGNLPNPQLGTHTGNESEEKSDQVRHSGSTVLALDLDANGVLDLVLGDVAYPNLTALINGGTAPNMNSPMISQDGGFPSSSVAANMQLFPASYYVDVTFDGKKDLLVAPNARTVSENQHSVLLYKNFGSNNQPNFQYQTNSFLQDESIDHGLGSIPMLIDQNGDGLKDLIVANFFRYKPVLEKESCLLAYRNIGTATDPTYGYLSDNYLNFLSIGMGYRSIPTFADLDNDSDQDMVVGKDNGTLLYFENTAGSGNPLAYAAPISLTNNLGGNISVPAYAAPQLFDLDNDGLTDLTIGTKTGEIVYYKNTGTSSAHQFTLTDATLGGVDLSASPDGYAVPHFFRVNDTTHLFLGAYDGKLHYYRDIDNNLHPDSTFELVSPQYLGISVGLYSSFWVEDIDQDGALNMFVGQDLGGLHHFEVNLSSSAALTDAEKLNLTLYPNPGTGEYTWFGNDNIPVQFEVTDLSGRIILSDMSTQFSISGQPAGYYLVRARFKDRAGVVKVMKK